MTDPATFQGAGDGGHDRAGLEDDAVRGALVNHRSLVIEWRARGDLKPYERNPRTHSKEQIAQIVASIKEFGFTNPLLIDEHDGVIAGHGRLMAAGQMDMAEVPCLVLSGLSESQRRALVIADNKLALNAGWDDALLLGELQALDGLGFDLELTGFTMDDFDALKPRGGGLTDEDEVPILRGDPVTRAGDIWLLDGHRLMCGSCTDSAAVERLCAGVRADLCLTDPPYGLGGAKDSGKNDYHEYKDTRENLIELAQHWLPIAREVAKVVVFSPGVTNQWLYPEPNWVMCWFYGGGQLRSPWGFNCWQPFLCYGKEPGLAAGKGARPDAVDMNTPANASEIDHPCPKPVKLWEWFLERLIFKRKAVLFEPFSGSGTTLIAAENMVGLKVLAMELVPYYCDVALMRWQAYSGKQATREADGVLFDALRPMLSPAEEIAA